MADLQKQGVPIPSRLRGPSVPSQTRSGVTPRAKNATASRGSASARKKPGSARQYAKTAAAYNPATLGGNAAGGVGLLEAEFLAALGLLILLMFSSSASYTDKIMSVMKRGTLLCALFFILALVASIGPNTAKGAKAFGALIIVAILVTSPVNTVLVDIDALIKNDWAGTAETGGTGSGNNGSASADNGTGGSSSSAAQDIINAIQNALNGMLPGTGGLKL